MEDSDFKEEEIFRRKVTYLKHKDVFVEVKAKRRTGKCIGTSTYSLPSKQQQQNSTTLKNLNDYNHISYDVWYHISHHILPKDVQNFALICRQTASIVKTKRFWMNLYKRYCQNDTEWNLLLPERLQIVNIRNCDMSSFRTYVIEALFYSYAPFVNFLKKGYSLDSLVGQTYKASWHMHLDCHWVMIYKFSNNASIKKLSPCSVVDDWESLTNDNENSISNPHEGISLLVVSCERFVPFPSNLLYEMNGNARVRLQVARLCLEQNMRDSRLELDFVDSNQTTTTVKYSPIHHKVVWMPWWHPKFRSYVKYDHIA